MLRDLEFFKTKLQHVNGFGDTADYLVGIVKSKQVKSASPPPSENKSGEEKLAEATKTGEVVDVTEAKVSTEKTDSTESEPKNGA